MTEKLKPCPCCGGAGVLYNSKNFMLCSVSCEKCGFRTPYLCKTPEEAIGRWNNRTTKNNLNDLDIANCPLCGNEEILHHEDGYYKHMFCTKCFAAGAEYRTLYEAIDAWNRRVGRK